MYFFCTYFDHHYLARGLALYESLRRHCPSFKLWILCMDSRCQQVLQRMSLPNVNIIGLQEFEKGDRELIRAKGTRSVIEYYFTCTPSLPLFVLNNFPEVDTITYLDADLFFFSDPAPIFDELAGNSVGIFGHRFPPELQHLRRFGIYNVSWLSFRRDRAGLASLRWWRDRCIEWCYDRYENGRFADQKYLDDWPERFRNVVVLTHRGANVAPWNLKTCTLRAEGQRVLVDDQPLIFFHFHGFRQIAGPIYDPGFAKYGIVLPEIPWRSILGPYTRTLSSVTVQVAPFLQTGVLADGIRKDNKAVRSHRRFDSLRRGLADYVHVWQHFGNLVRGRYIVVVNNKMVWPPMSRRPICTPS